MVKKGTKKPRKIAKTDRFPLIDKALRKRTKAELIETILMIAKDHPVVARELESRLDGTGVELPGLEPVAQILQGVLVAAHVGAQLLNDEEDDLTYWVIHSISPGRRGAGSAPGPAGDHGLTPSSLDRPDGRRESVRRLRLASFLLTDCQNLF